VAALVVLAGACAANADVLTDQAADLALVPPVLADLGSGCPDAEVARDHRQVLVLAIGGRDLVAGDALIAVAAFDGGSRVGRRKNGQRDRSRNRNSHARWHHDLILQVRWRSRPKTWVQVASRSSRGPRITIRAG